MIFNVIFGWDWGTPAILQQNSPFGKIEIKAALPITQVPDDQKWRLGLLDSLLRERSTLLSEGQDAKCVISMISSLCNT